jgi:hypothetical protein
MTGYGAGDGADMLQQILHQKATEAFQQGQLQLEQQRNQQQAQLQAAQLRSIEEERAAREAEIADKRGTDTINAIGGTPGGTVLNADSPALKILNASYLSPLVQQDKTLNSTSLSGAAPMAAVPPQTAINPNTLTTTPLDAGVSGSSGTLMAAANPGKIVPGQFRVMPTAQQQQQSDQDAQLDQLAQSNPQFGQALRIIRTLPVNERGSSTADAVKAILTPPKAPPVTEADMDSQYQTILQKQANNIPLSANEQATKKAYEARKTLVPNTTFTLNQPKTTDARTDKSYEYNQNILDKMRTPVVQTAQKINDLDTAINQQTPMADSLLAPKFLSVMVGGQGSGLRMTKAELDRIAGGAGKFQQLQSWAQTWNTDPSKATPITPAQRDQIKSLVSAVKADNSKQLAALDKADNDMLDATSVQDHRRIVNIARQAIEPGAGNTVSDAVTGALKGKPDGHYTLSDGSKWTVSGGQISAGG